MINIQTTNKKNSGKTVKYIFIILLVYSLIPIEIPRVYGIPMQYIPFYLLIISGLIRHKWNFKLGTYSEYALLGFLAITLFQPFFFELTFKDYSLEEYLKDFLPLILHISGFFLFKRIAKKALTQDKTTIAWIYHIITICSIIGFLRYYLIDITFFSPKYFNIFQPLDYRFMEVLILLFALPLMIINDKYGGGYLFAKGLFKSNTATWLSFSILTSAIIIAGSRTGYIGYVSMLLVAIIALNFKILIRVALISAIVVPVIMSSPKVYERIERLSEVIQIYSADSNVALESGKSIRRTIYTEGAINMTHNNIFYGVGLGNFQEKFPSAISEKTNLRYVTRPHNTYLSLSSTIGIPATILFFLWILLKLIDTLKKSLVAKTKSKYKYYYFAFAAFYLSIIVTAAGYDYQTNPIFFLLIGLSAGFTSAIDSMSASER